jgi:hypothetical protein
MDGKTLASLGDDPGIAELSKLIGEYAVALADTGDTFRVRVYYDILREWDHYRFELSHYPKTPTQAGPYMPSSPWSSSEEGALRRAIAAVTDYFAEAKGAGHQPSTEWLVPNKGW